MYYCRHFVEANRNMQSYHRLFLASQQSYERLKSLSGSDGAQGFRVRQLENLHMYMSSPLIS